MSDGLKIAGLGGSGPIHYIEKDSKEEKRIWVNSAYPYFTDDDYKEAL